MSNRASIAGGLLLVASALAAPAPGDEILGTWVTDGGESKVAIARSGDVYTGKVTWIKAASPDGKPVLDVRNSNSALRSRPVLGIEILSGFTRAADGLWKGGIVYSPRKGESYPAEIAVAKDGRLDIKVKDGMFSKHVFWTR